jgi:NADPH:quinone reductase
MRTVAHRVAAAQALARNLLLLLASGQVVPLVDRVFPFEELPAAQRCMEGNQHLGKVMVRVG